MSETHESDIVPSPHFPRALLISRHSLTTRLTHWINLLCIIVLMMSGLQIFNAHPALYWGQSGADPRQAFFEIGARGSWSNAKGFVRAGGLTFDTTGIFGVSRIPNGHEAARAAPYRRSGGQCRIS